MDDEFLLLIIDVLSSANAEQQHNQQQLPVEEKN